MANPRHISLLIEKPYSDLSFLAAATFYSRFGENSCEESLYLLQPSALATNLDSIVGNKLLGVPSPLLSD
jgi:hypothetical protein